MTNKNPRIQLVIPCIIYVHTSLIAMFSVRMLTSAHAHTDDSKVHENNLHFNNAHMMGTSLHTSRCGGVHVVDRSVVVAREPFQQHQAVCDRDFCEFLKASSLVCETTVQCQMWQGRLIQSANDSSNHHIDPIVRHKTSRTKLTH